MRYSALTCACGLQVYGGRPDRAAQHLLCEGAEHVMELYDFML